MADKERLRDILAEITRLDAVKNCSLSSEPLSGVNNWVYWLVPENATETVQPLCLRVPKKDDWDPLIVRGMEIQDDFAHKTLSPLVPRIHYLDHRFAIMDRVDGTSIDSWDEFRQDEHKRSSTLDGLADFLCVVWTTCMSSSVGFAEEPPTYRAWLETLVDRCFRRALTLAEHLWGDPITFLIRRRAMDAIAQGSHTDKGQFVRVPDLNETNVMVDASGSLTGVIDWDVAELLPLASSVHVPQFLANIPGWVLPGRAEGPDFLTDREYLFAAIQDRLHDKPDVAARIAGLLNTSFERQFFELALFSRDINRHYVRLRCSGEDVDAIKDQLREQLDQFLNKNEDLRDSERVLSLWERLA